MKSFKKSLNNKFGKKYQNAGTVTPLFPKSGPELTYPADVTYGSQNLTGAFPTGQPLTGFDSYMKMSNNPVYSNPSNMFKIPASPGNYTTSNQPQGTITDENYSFAPGVFNDKEARSTFTPMMSPLNIYDVNLNTSQVEQGPLTEGQASDRGAQGEEIKPNNKFKLPNLDYNSALTLGLGLTSTILNNRQDQQNRRMLQQSIQNRESNPVYDYNYMYGRTTSGGTEFQPIVKAEMGAQINKRYNTPSTINNVEIEGGEFLQLPDMSTEMAYGPSHSNGGIQTSLPEGTRVFSNHLKPKGSKKTFAQMAKKYDNTEYDKILDNKFAKQVDKDTAMLMKQKNQTMLNKLFMDQQLLNGNSTGEPMNMAKDGASIDNAGFRALPKAVQEKILANMESGGFSLPNPLYMQKGAVQPKTANRKTQQSNIPANLSESGKSIPTYTEDEVNLIRKYDPNFTPTLGTVPGMQRTVDGVYGSTGNVDIFNQNYDWYTSKFKEQYGRDFDPKSKKDVGLAQKAYQDEMTNRFIKAGYTPEEATSVLKDVGFVNEQGLPNTFDEKLGFYTATRKLFDVAPKQKPTEKTPEEKPKETPKTPDFQTVQGKESGKYYRQPFPLMQAVPGIMGLAASQEIFPYAIPEVDPQYIRPQTLNIQSQLQDIDNMGQAAVRAGADPLSAYIAGVGGKEKAYQTKQNFDAQGRMQADVFNAQSAMDTSRLNAAMFDRTYNNLIAQARDAQTAEKQAAVTSIINNYNKYNQDENLKSLYLDNLQSAFDIGRQGASSFELAPNGMPRFYYDNMSNVQNQQVDSTTTNTSNTKKSNTK